jgi:hypothetical protein
MIRSWRIAVVAVPFLAACSSDDPGEGNAAATPVAGAAVSIVTDVDFTATPFGGTFRVEEGSDVLGCSSGTFVDSEAEFDGIYKVLTCDSGSNGTFTVRAHTMSLGCDGEDPETCSGTWSVDAPRSTGDFVGLHGFGEFEVFFDEPNSAVETIAGEIHVEP